MRVAIVGAGFAGLALSWYLIHRGCQVTVFHSEPIGEGGASAIAAGLMHPYPGEQVRRSRYAEEAMAASRELLDIAARVAGRPVADFSGILRHANDEAQKELLIQRSVDYPDMVRVSDHVFLIKSGVTVFSHAYLNGLAKACQTQGVLFEQEHIQEANFQGFNHVILANGAGLLKFPWANGLKLKLIKGQVLECRLPPGLLTRSLVGKGYVALGEGGEGCILGATFEREFIDAVPNKEQAKELLLPKIRPFFPEVDQLEIIQCRAAYRVAQEGDYLPLMKQVGEKYWVLGAFGSRGLLYHAFFAKQLTEFLLK